MPFVISGSLPFPKNDRTPVLSGSDVTKYLRSSDWNSACQAIDDIRVWIHDSGSLGGGITGSYVTASFQFSAGNGLVGTGPLTGTVLPVSLSPSGTAGTYDKLTVDAFGRVSSGSSGNWSASGSYVKTTVQAVAGNGLQGTGQLTGSVFVFGLTPSGTAGSYTNANITVDAFGRVSAASNGTGGGSSGTSGITGSISQGWVAFGSSVSNSITGSSNFTYDGNLITTNRLSNGELQSWKVANSEVIGLKYNTYGLGDYDLVSAGQIGVQNNTLDGFFTQAGVVNVTLGGNGDFKFDTTGLYPTTSGLDNGIATKPWQNGYYSGSLFVTGSITAGGSLTASAATVTDSVTTPTLSSSATTLPLKFYSANTIPSNTVPAVLFDTSASWDVGTTIAYNYPAYRWRQNGLDLLALRGNRFSNTIMYFYEGVGGALIGQLSFASNTDVGFYNSVGTPLRTLFGDLITGADLTYKIGSSIDRRSEVWSRRYAGVEQTLYASSGSSIAFDPAKGESIRVFLNGSVTSITGTLGYPGEKMTVQFIQDSTGNRGVSGWSTGAGGFKIADGLYTPSPSSGSRDIFTFAWDSVNLQWMESARTLNV